MTRHFFPHFSLSVRVCLAALIVMLLAGPVLAQRYPSEPREVSSPDVIVLVFSGTDAFDQVSINYSTAVTAERARKDMDAIKETAGWLIRNPQVTTEKGTAPGAKPTTSSHFETPPLANSREGTLPIEPFITALKRYHAMQIIYLVQRQFDFRGLKDFRNHYVNIHLRQSGGTYTYHVGVNDSGFDRLGLPLTDVKPAEAEETGPPGGARMLLVVGAALAAGVLVYLVVSLLTRSRNGSRRAE